MMLLVLPVGLGIFGGCDSGKKVVDEVSGNRAVKQFHEAKKDIGKIADQQTKRLKGIQGDDQKEDEE